MIVVVDPGVAIKWFVEEPLRPQARSLLVNRHELIAPDILIAGVADLAWKKAASGEITAEQADVHRPQHRLAVLHLGLRRIAAAAQPRLRARAAMRPAGARMLLCRLRRGYLGDCWSAPTRPSCRRCSADGIPLRGVPLARVHELDAA